MDFIISLLISVGVVLMMINIAMFYSFLRDSMDVLSGGHLKTQIYVFMAFFLLVFFLGGYGAIWYFSTPDIMIASVLFGGSVFVAIVITMIETLMNTVKKRSLDVAQALIDGIEARDPNLNGHSRYVQNLVMRMWKDLPFDIKEAIPKMSIEYAALLHDVGKLGVPESVLNKPGALDDDEWELMKQHPAIGAKILKKLHFFNKITPWIEYHHERLDGKGYYGLAEDEIPYSAKIIAVADTYSAITMRRSYKEPKSYEEAIKILNEVKGTQLDTELVDLFCKIPKKDIIACIPDNVEA